MSIPGYDAWKTRAPGDGPYDPVEELEDDDEYAEFVEELREERISKGLDPDTGLSDQP